MIRNLLFDSGCAVCSDIAEAVNAEADGWLTARSLLDPEIVKTLDAHAPGWTHRPMLLEVEEGKVRVSSGLEMSWRMFRGLGVRRTHRVMGLAANALTPSAGPGRRSFLAAASGTVGILAIGMGASPVWGAGTPRAEVLDGARLAAAARRASRAPDVGRARVAITDQGYDLSQEKVVAIRGDSDDLVVMFFYAHRERPETDAAIISHDGDGSTFVEYVSAQSSELFAGDEFHPEALQVTQASSGGFQTMGAGAYFSCIAACVGANCGALALRCRGLIFMYAVLACMAGICGSKVHTCHKVCKSAW